MFLAKWEIFINREDIKAKKKKQILKNFDPVFRAASAIATFRDTKNRKDCLPTVYWKIRVPEQGPAPQPTSVPTLLPINAPTHLPTVVPKTPTVPNPVLTNVVKTTVAPDPEVKGQVLKIWKNNKAETKSKPKE